MKYNNCESSCCVNCTEMRTCCQTGEENRWTERGSYLFHYVVGFIICVVFTVIIAVWF